MKESLLELLDDSLYLLKIAAVVAVPVALLMCHVWNQYRITELGYEVAEQTEDHRQLLEEERKLRIETTFQSHSDGATALAGEEFGLRAVQPGQVIQVREGEEPEEGPAEQAALERPIQ
ncbi:MAG: hypothetical protein ACOCV2_01900 [Persicimonas sp.]